MKVLFVVTAFYPEQAIGSIRITKFAKFLQKQGGSISVISLAPPPWANRDESLYFHGLEEMQWDVIDQSWIFKKIFQKMRVATIGTVPGNAGMSSTRSKVTLKIKIRAFAQFLYTLFKAIDWSFRVKKHALKNFSKDDFDFIFCSYPSFASPLSGIMLKKLGIGKNVIADFRDPILAKKKSGFSLKKSLQNFIIRHADLQLFVSSGVRHQMVGDKFSSNNLIAPNGFDSQDIDSLKESFPNNSKKNILKFVYTGAIYSGKRDLRPFFKGISNILSNSSYSLEQLRFEYAGKEGDIFLLQAKEFGLSECVVDHGQVSRSESLILQQQSDICLLATWNTSFEQGALTGKIFEYFMLKKPVLAIVVGDLEGSEISKIIRTVGAGHCFEAAAPNSFKELESWLEYALYEKRTNGSLQCSYNEKVDTFEIREVVKNIKSRMDKLLEEQMHT